ncbi:MAG: hypothetical protein MUC87_21335 [Bacteroidia bacterium]|jgi:hypothetical protein|nr:hypothetical protein [Bacteroidia bacterium]
MSDQSNSRDIILQLLREKSKLKQDVFYTTIDLFNHLKEVVRTVANELKPLAEAIDKRIVVEFRERNAYEIELRVAGDVLLFHMHTNVFEFDTSHHIWKTGYVKESPARSYCGVINIYNFLADSFKYQRLNDLGYLIARVFVNNERHFFVEGKRQLGFLYNDFPNSVINDEVLRQIVESTIVYCLDFDLFTPPFDEVKVITLGQVQEDSSMMSLKTGKRLGFRFQADTDYVGY